MSLFDKLFMKTIFALLLKSGLIWLGIGVTIGMNAPMAVAAEEVIFYSGVVSESVSLEELENFAKIGKISPSLEFLFKFSQQNPKFARYILNQEFSVEVIWIANLFNSIPGQFFLGQTSKIVHSKSKRANIQALRGSLIKSASDDNKVSLLEILQNYPTEQVYVDGKVFSQSFKRLNNLIDIL